MHERDTVGRRSPGCQAWRHLVGAKSRHGKEVEDFSIARLNLLEGGPHAHTEIDRRLSGELLRNLLTRAAYPGTVAEPVHGAVSGHRVEPAGRHFSPSSQVLVGTHKRVLRHIRRTISIPQFHENEGIDPGFILVQQSDQDLVRACNLVPLRGKRRPGRQRS